jgi:hypothetical protein
LHSPSRLVDFDDALAKRGSLLDGVPFGCTGRLRDKMKLSTSAITWKRAAPVRFAADMIEIAGLDRRNYFFDSFEGLPPAKEIDGTKAKQWQADLTTPANYDNCKASLEDFQNTIKMTGYQSEAVEIDKGFFENTLPALRLPSDRRLKTRWRLV